jgi:hypothetical protein
MGRVLLTMRSGRRTPMAAIPTPDLAVPYEAPKQVKTIAAVQPIAPKKGCDMLARFILRHIRIDRIVEKPVGSLQDSRGSGD